MWTAHPQPSHPFKGFLSEDAKWRNCVTCLTLKTLKAIPCSAAHPSRPNKGVTPLPPPPPPQPSVRSAFFFDIGSSRICLAHVHQKKKIKIENQ